MDTTYSNVSRVGNITSSEIVSLMKNGKAAGSVGVPFYTYVDECNMERRLGRSISTESNAQPLTWGLLVEKRVFNLLGLEYKLCSSETIAHPEIECWKGSPDGEKHETVIDIKSPITMKSFCELVDPYYELKGDKWVMVHKACTIEAVRANHKDGDKYYWQLVSNAILTGAKYAELIVYCPFQDELEEIRMMAQEVDVDQLYRYAWINYKRDEELPYLHRNGQYKNINIIRFEVPEVDKINLTTRVRMAEKLLIKTEPK